MNTNIYQADSTVWAKEHSLNDLLKRLPSSFHKRAVRYQFEQDAYNFVLGRLLLDQGLKDFNLSGGLKDIKYESSGKPYIDRTMGIHFNISHSDDLVLCAVSLEGRLGIDVEKSDKRFANQTNILPITLANFKSFFTPTEWEDINQADEPLTRFYTYWTRKESIIKALGINLRHLHQIAIDPLEDTFNADGHLWHLKELDLGEGCFGVICTESRVTGINIKVVEAF